MKNKYYEKAMLSKSNAMKSSIMEKNVMKNKIMKQCYEKKNTKSIRNTIKFTLYNLEYCFINTDAVLKLISIVMWTIKKKIDVFQ